MSETAQEFSSLSVSHDPIQLPTRHLSKAPGPRAGAAVSSPRTGTPQPGAARVSSRNSHATVRRKAKEESARGDAGLTAPSRASGEARERLDWTATVPRREGGVSETTYRGLALRVHVHQGTPVPRPVHLSADVARESSTPRSGGNWAGTHGTAPWYRRVGGGTGAGPRPTRYLSMG